MRATGIVRRIDELGRVVIPKEIRRTLRIREGDPLEIFTDHDGEVVLKKYSPIGEIASIAKDYTDSLYRTLGHVALISDRDAVVSSSGAAKREYVEKALSPEALAGGWYALEMYIRMGADADLFGLAAEGLADHISGRPDAMEWLNSVCNE